MSDSEEAEYEVGEESCALYAPKSLLIRVSTRIRRGGEG